MSEPSSTSAESGTQRIVAVVPDVFFSVTVRNAIRGLGYQPVIVTSAEAARQQIDPPPALVIIDITSIPDEDGWQAVSEVVSGGIPVLAFGPHKDVDGLRRAKAAGVTRVVANSQFHREMAALIQRYASAGPAEG